MGIYGLQTFMEKKCKGGFEFVNLLELIELYRCKTGENPVILYELSSGIKDLTLDSFKPFICGGLKAFKKNVEIFINNFSELGVNLKVIGSGCQRPFRLEDWIKKNEGHVRNLEKLYSGDFSSDKFFEEINPLNLYLVGNLIFQTSDKCEFIRSIYKAEEYIINHIKKNHCFAILTNDSNFIVMEGAQYCLSSKKLNLGTMTTYNYNRKNLAKHFDINISQLPLFGSLFFGSYYFKSFNKKHEIRGKNTFGKAIELVKKLPSGEEILQGKISDYQDFLKMDKENLSAWKERLNFFFGSSKYDIMSTGSKNWDEILTVAEIRHTKGVSSFIFEVLTLRTVYLPPDWSNVLKPLPDSALLPLRKQLYGILFFENPDTKISVTEHYYKYCEDIKKTKYMCRIVNFQRKCHPGLLQMWSKFPSENIQEEKRKVFCQALDEKLSPSDLKDIQEELLFPFLSTFYLFWKSEIKLQEFEINILLIQVVLVNSFLEEEIEKLAVDINIDALDLSSWFIKTINHLNFLNFICGDPFCLKKTNLINFFDGKILHYVYNIEKDAKFGTKNLNSWSPKLWRKFKFLKNKLYQIGYVCGLNPTKKKII